MRTLGRVTHGLAWTAAAGLLALLISTNCADPIGVVRPFHCMFDFECSGAERCDTDTGQMRSHRLHRQSARLPVRIDLLSSDRAGAMHGASPSGLRRRQCFG